MLITEKAFSHKIIERDIDEILKLISSQESLENLKVFNHKEREGYVNKLLDYYNGNNTSQYIAEKFDLEAFREVPPYQSNITKKFINKMSRIYTVGASRNVNNKYSALTKLKDTKMKHIERIWTQKALTLTINLYIISTLSLEMTLLNLLQYLIL